MIDFQTLILRLSTFWAQQKCILIQPYDGEVGAGTFVPATFFGTLGPASGRVGYVQPSRRPSDGRYGENPNRLYLHHQYQVVIKPPPPDIQASYLKSLIHLGIDPHRHDIRFVEDDWESPTLGASGLGWEVWCDGLEVTQFTYFQQMGGFELEPVSVELTYGLERIAMFLQGVDNVFDLVWAPGIRYDEIRRQKEYEFSRYSFQEAPVEQYLNLFTLFEQETLEMVKKGLVYPAYDLTLKCSHIFNLLDARGAISVNERANFIARVRSLAKNCAELYLLKFSGE